MSDDASQPIRVRYDHQETGWAIPVGDGLAIIENIPVTHRCNLGDVVRLQLTDGLAPAWVDEVVYRRYAAKTILYYHELQELQLLCGLLKLLGCESEGALRPVDFTPGVLMVAHDASLRPELLAGAAGVPQPFGGSTRVMLPGGSLVADADALRLETADGSEVASWRPAEWAAEPDVAVSVLDTLHRCLAAASTKRGLRKRVSCTHACGPTTHRRAVLRAGVDSGSGDDEVRHRPIEAQQPPALGGEGVVRKHLEAEAAVEIEAEPAEIVRGAARDDERLTFPRFEEVRQAGGAPVHHRAVVVEVVQALVGIVTGRVVEVPPPGDDPLGPDESPRALDVQGVVAALRRLAAAGDRGMSLSEGKALKVGGAVRAPQRQPDERAQGALDLATFNLQPCTMRASATAFGEIRRSVKG
jgi:hypothetical protein